MKLKEKFIKKVLKLKDLIIQRSTPKEKVIKLIKKLHPTKTQFELIRVGPNKDGGYLGLPQIPLNHLKNNKINPKNICLYTNL